MTTLSDESRFLALEEARLCAETSQSFARLREAVAAAPKRMLSTLKRHRVAAGGAAAGVAGVAALIWWLAARRSRRAPAAGKIGPDGTTAPRDRRGARGWIRMAVGASHLLSTVAALLAALRGGEAPRRRSSEPSLS